MATAATSTPTEGKFYETLHKYQSDFIKHKTHDGRRKCAVQFRVYIDTESRTKGIEEFTSFLQEINRTLVQLIGSANIPEKLCGIYLLDELIEVPYEENEIKITRFAQHLRMIYDSNDSFNLYLYQCAINVFGHLVRVGGVLVADLILGEARKSLELLRGDKPDKHVTALLILKSLAENAPTLFSPYLDSCIDSIWPTLHSSNENVRNCALDTLHQCILLVNTRLPAQRDQLYTRINTEILGLFKLNTADAIQGGLRAIALLLIYGGDFLLPFFNKVLELVFQHKEHRDRAVRDTVVLLIPTLIAYSPTSFQSGTQLPSLISHVISILHKAQHESSISIAYISLGKIAIHTGQALLYRLDVIANLVKEGLRKKSRTTHSSVLQCLSMLSRALGLALLPYATDLVDLLFDGGLSPALVNTLAELAHNLPVLLPSIQSRLLSAISLILSQVDINNTTITKSTASFLSRAGILMTGGSGSAPVPAPSTTATPGTWTPGLEGTTSSSPGTMSSGPPGLLTMDEDFDPNSPTGLIALALSTLGLFDFTSHNLLPFVYQRVLPWLNATDARLRSQTAKCCLNIVLRPPSNPLTLHLSQYLQIQDIVFAIQDQIQLQQRLLIIIAGDGTLQQNREMAQDDFFPDAISAPKQWNDDSNQYQAPTTGRRTRTGSISVANSRLLTLDIKNTSNMAIKPVAPLPVTPNGTPSTSTPFSLRPSPSSKDATSPKLGATGGELESPRGISRGFSSWSPGLSTASGAGVGLSSGAASTPKALLNVARKLKYQIKDQTSATPRPSFSFSGLQSKDRLMGQIYQPQAGGIAGAPTGSRSARPSAIPLQPGSIMPLGSGFSNSNSYGVELFNNLLKVQFQVLTQLQVQMELFLSLQRQNFNNSNTFGSTSINNGSTNPNSTVGITEGIGFGLGRYTGNTTTTLAQTLSQDAHQLLAQIQVALLQVQQEQQLVLQAQAAGIDMSGLATSAIFDHLTRHKRRTKPTIQQSSAQHLQQFGPLGGKSVSPPVDGGNDYKREIDSQILIRAYISSGMAQELGINDLAHYQNQGQVNAVQYKNNIAHCVLPKNDQQVAFFSSKQQTQSKSQSTQTQTIPDSPNQTGFSSKGNVGLSDDLGGAQNVQSLPKGWTIMVNEVLTRLTAITLSDPDPSIRHNVLSLLTPHFDVYLSQPHHLLTLINVLKDPLLENKNVALTILCRLMPLNPILVLPILRHFITETAYQLQLSGSPKTREDSAVMLGCIASHASTFIRPYAIPVLKVLVKVLLDVQSPSVASGILSAIGEMALVAGCEGYPVVAPILPLLFCIIFNKESHSIQSKSSSQQSLASSVPTGNTAQVTTQSTSSPPNGAKVNAGSTTTTTVTTRSQVASPVLALLQGHTTVIGISHYVALRCLRLICASAGLVIGPYHLFPALLSTLIKIVCNTLSTQARNEALQLIGSIGAVDPFVAKLLHVRAQQLTGGDMVRVLIQGIKEVFTTSSITIALNSSPTSAASQGTVVAASSTPDSSNVESTTGQGQPKDGFLKATTALLRGADVEQSTLDDEVLRLLLYTKTLEMEGLLQQIRLQSVGLIGFDGENDGCARTTELAQQKRLLSRQQLTAYNNNPNHILQPYPGNALVNHSTSVSEYHYDELYHVLNRMSSTNGAGVDMDAENMYRAYVMFEQQIAATNSDLDVGDDDGEHLYARTRKANHNNQLTYDPTIGDGVSTLARRGQSHDQQVQPADDDVYATLYDLSSISLQRQKRRETKDPTNAMIQMLTASMAQANPASHAGASSGINGQGGSNNILQLIKLSQPASEIAPELDIAGNDYYRLTAVHALIEILQDPAQSQSHKKAVIALMFIFKTMGADCYKLLPHIVPVFTQALSYYNDDLRRIILEQLGSMALLTKKHFKVYISPILHLITIHWSMVSTIPQPVFLLIQRMATVDTNEIQIHMPELLPKLLSILLNDKTPNRNLSQDVLRALQSLIYCLEPYLHLILPALIQVWAIGSDSPLFVRCLSLHTTAQLLRSVHSISHVPRLVLPLLELIQSSQHVTATAVSATSGKQPPLVITVNGTIQGSKSEPKPDLMTEALQTLCVLVYLMGPRYSKHILSTQSLLAMKNVQHHTLQLLFTKILSQIQLTTYDLPQPLPIWKNDNVDPIFDLYNSVSNPFSLYDEQWVMELGLAKSAFVPSTKQPHTPVKSLLPGPGSTAARTPPPSPPESITFEKLPVNQTNLIKAWDASQRLTSDDWIEWMKGVCVGMLKDSPFPPLRACFVLAQKDHKLAQNLFTVGFASCWNELNDVYQDAIVNALDQALKSPTTPSDILSALLSLCEFMEHDDRPLPLDIRQLAHLSATKCHSFAKALHYKEQEFYTSSTPSLLLEDLISTHNKLQQPQAAIGILKMATSLPEFRGSLQENWYEQLHRWDEALAAYERKQLNEGLDQNHVEDLSGEQLAALQQLHARNRFQNGSILGSIVGQVSSTFSLASSMQTSEVNTNANSNPFSTLGNTRGMSSTPSFTNTHSGQNSPFRLAGSVNVDTILGRLRCLKALGDYDRVAKISIDLWNQLQHIALNLQKEIQTFQQNSILSSSSPLTIGGTAPSSSDGRDSMMKQSGSLQTATLANGDSRSTFSSNSGLPTQLSSSIPQHLSYELNVLPDLMSEVASLACESLHMLGKWDDLPQFFNALSPQTIDRSFYNAIYYIHTGNLSEAEAHLRSAKRLVQDDVYALLGEGYNRAYNSIVGIHLFTELEEVVLYKRLGGHLSTNTTTSSISSYISHARSHTHALSLARMKPLQDTNNSMSYLHSINPFIQSNLHYQSQLQLQSPYSISFDMMSNYAVNNHGAINQLVNDHNHAIKLQEMRQKSQHHFPAPRLPPRPSTSGPSGSSAIHHVVTPQQHQQMIVAQLGETRLLQNAVYTYFQRNASFASKHTTNHGVNHQSLAVSNYHITNNTDYTSKPSVTCAAHLTTPTTSWSELLARTQQRALIRTSWNQRLKMVQRNPYVWRHLLATRSLVLTPQQNAKFWIQYTHMTSNMGRFDHSLDILKKLLHRNPHQAPLDFDLHVTYLQSDPFLSPRRIESGSAAHEATKSTTSDSLPSFSLDAKKPINEPSTSTHRPRRLMYLPSANTFLQAISVTKPHDPYTQMMRDIFDPSATTQCSTFSHRQQITNTTPDAIYQFSFGVSSQFDNMFDLLELSMDPSKSANNSSTHSIKSTQTRQHFYQPDFFGFNLDSTTHPLLSVGAIAISPVTLAAAHHTYMISNPHRASRSKLNEAALGSQSSRLGPMGTPLLNSQRPPAHVITQDDENEVNKAKFHPSYMAYPCALDDFLVSLAYCQHLWRVGHRNAALDRLTYLTHVLEYLLELTPHTHSPLHHNVTDYLEHIQSVVDPRSPKSSTLPVLSPHRNSTISMSRPEDYHIHLPGNVVYIKHHRFCPHHPLYHLLSEEEIALEHRTQHEKEQQSATKGYLVNNYIPLVCTLSVCPPPQRNSSEPEQEYNEVKSDDSSSTPTLQIIPNEEEPLPHDQRRYYRDEDNQWFPLAPIRPTQRSQLTSLASKLNRITGDWGLSILSSISPSFGINFQGVSDSSIGFTNATSKSSAMSTQQEIAHQATVDLDLANLPRVTRDVAETFALSATLEAYQRSTLYSPQRYRGWHGWAVIHYRAAQIIRVTKQNVSSTLALAQKQFSQSVNNPVISARPSESTVKTWSQEIHQLLHDYDSLNKHLHLHVVAAITGFLHSVSLSRDTSQSLQDLLRLLALWFSHGGITGRKLYLPAPNAILTSTMIEYTAPPTSSTSPSTSPAYNTSPLSSTSSNTPKPQNKSKSIRQQYQDVIGLPPVVLGENKLPAVADVLRQGFNSLPITTWVVVSPQIIARLHSSSAKGTIRVLIQELLLMIGQYHPQALVYPLTVAVKSEQPSLNRTVKQHVLSVALHRGLTIYGPTKNIPKPLSPLSQSALSSASTGVHGNIGMVHGPDGTSGVSDGEQIKQSNPQHTHNTALQVMSRLRSISPLLIEQSMVVSRELIRAAVLWHEIWHEALEEASRLWFTQQDPISMLALLLPLHQKIGLGSHSMVQIATAPQNHYIPTENVISNLVTALPAFQISSKDSRMGLNNYGANVHQNLFSGPETPRETAFIHIFGRELSLAHDWCLKYLSHMAEEELNIDSTQMWYNGEVIGKLKKDLEGYQPGVQFYHPPRAGIQAMNDFLIQQHELNQRAFFARTEDIFSQDISPSKSQSTSSDNTVAQLSGAKPLSERKHVPHASDLNQAWAIYCTVFRQINKMISQGGDSAQFFELHDVSPILLSCQDLVLAIPGTYDPKRHSNTICISRVISHFKIIESKQRPRKLSIIGSDGEEHPFLLKGHEDLRQDTRVMQLFDLVNALLSSSTSSSSNTNGTTGANTDGNNSGSNTSSAAGGGSGSGGGNSSVSLAAQGTNGSSGSQSNDLDLNLRGYSVTPLSPVSGVIQWLSNCDTLHALIKNYRDARFVLISAENKLMGQVSSNCQTVKVLQKVEVFEHALSNTNGRDLADVLWLKASTSEQWLERRNNYTRSLAVTSIVGYILGLGDRHPCNLMLERTSAKVIHIDFGDCFEVAQHREKFPERVPFRLTRVLVRALEVSGIEGTFRLTCEHVMQTLRASKESVMAVLEAFIYDPLITWRLLHDGNAANVPNQVPGEEDLSAEGQQDVPNISGAGQSALPIANAKQQQLTPTVQYALDDIAHAISTTLGDDLHSDNIFNAKALSVIERIESKLNGTDFHGRWNLAIQQRNKRVTKDKIKCMLGFGLDVVVSQDGYNKHLDGTILSSQEQVELLIQLATNSQVLASAYSGWCPYL